MLDFVPESRATAQQMLAHPWLQGRYGKTGELLPSALYTPRGATEACGPMAPPTLTATTQPVVPAGNGASRGASMDVDTAGEDEEDEGPRALDASLLHRVEELRAGSANASGSGSELQGQPGGSVAPSEAAGHVHREGADVQGVQGHGVRSDSPSPIGHDAAAGHGGLQAQPQDDTAAAAAAN